MLFVILVSRIDSFHSHIEAQNEIIEVQPQSETVGQCYLLIEILKLKLTTGLISVSAQGPDVSRVDECSSVELPEQMRPHLSIEVEFHVTGLIYEVDASVVAPERSRPQLSYAPSPHRVSATGKVSFLEGKHRAVAVRPRYSKVGVQHKLRFGSERNVVSIVEIELHIFGISDIEELVVALGIAAERQWFREQAQYVAGRFNVGSQRVTRIAVRQSETLRGRTGGHYRPATPVTGKRWRRLDVVEP